jgi:type I restriction enzyme S subunit
VAGNVAVTADNYKKVYKNDIVVNIILCWQGAIGLSKHDGVTSPAYDVYKAKSNDVNVGYFNYLFRTPLFSGECYKAGRGIMVMRWRTYSDQFTAISAPLPPRDEQDQIVRYLDWKVSQINKLINAKRRQIALLGEKRRKAIDEAIGNAIGNKYRYRHLFSLCKGLGITKADLRDNGIPCVSYGEVHSKYGFEVNPDIHVLKCVDKNYLSSSPKSLLQYGDFVFADTSEDLAGSGNFTYLNSYSGCGGNQQQGRRLRTRPRP